MANPDVAKLETIAREGRVEILRMITHAGSGQSGRRTRNARASSHRPSAR